MRGKKQLYQISEVRTAAAPKEPSGKKQLWLVSSQLFGIIFSTQVSLAATINFLF